MASPKTNGQTDNTYRAHLLPDQRGIGPTLKAKPLHGFRPRNVTAEQVKKAMDGNHNPFTNTSYSGQYGRILKDRKKLPVATFMDEFYSIFNKNQIVILVGETGSGKTTQIPQFVVYSDLPHTKGKIIACTQPRRVAATSVAKRVAEEMDVQLGKQVGYSVRFEEMTDDKTTFLKYMTDGVLLREAMSDSLLSRYSTIILDEAHERTLATDILMGVLKSVAKKRPDLKIIVMSATLDAIKFQKYFSTEEKLAPLLKVPGLTHPVKILYTPKPVSDYVEAAIRTVLTIHQVEDPGDILVFLTGEQEIENACRKIKSEADRLSTLHPDTAGPLSCIPLYSSLPPEQQQRMYEPAPAPRNPHGPPGRKVVVSTNIAETSLTIDGIVYVVDPGFSKQTAYNARTRMESLMVLPISKASAQQRAGRAGRTRPGKCFRLYTENHFIKKMEEQDKPQILRSNLSSIVLILVKWGREDILQFDFIDPPPPETVMRGIELLNSLSALDDDRKLTGLGAMMAEFPLEPQLAKTLVVSPEFKCTNEILTIVSMLSVPNVWIRPWDKQIEADTAKSLLSVPDGDHLTLLNVYNNYMENLHDANWARQHYLSKRALQEAAEVRAQLRRIMERFDIDLLATTQSDTILYTDIRRALLCGFFMQIARKEGKKGEYLTVKDNQVVMLHPSCCLKTSPEWVLFNDYVLTSKPYIRTVTEVRPEWALENAASYFELRPSPYGGIKRALARILQY